MLPAAVKVQSWNACWPFAFEKAIHMFFCLLDGGQGRAAGWPDAGSVLLFCRYGVAFMRRLLQETATSE